MTPNDGWRCRRHVTMGGDERPSDPEPPWYWVKDFGVRNVRPPAWVLVCDHEWEPIQSYDESKTYGRICTACDETRMKP